MANIEKLVKEFGEIVRKGNEILIELRKLQTSGTFKESSDIVKNATEGVVKSEGLENKVSSILRTVSVPANIKGYAYARTAILMAVNNPELVHAVTKELYPAVAKEHGTTPSRVERAIRHAIDVAWSRADAINFEELFGYSKNTSEVKPTNSEFIALISDNLRLELK